MLEKSINPAASAAAGAAGGSKKITDFLIFGLKNQPTSPPDDYMLFNLKKDGTTQPFSTSEVFQGTTVFANNTDDGYRSWSSRNGFKRFSDQYQW